jgi:Recombination endonuclease VII
LPQTPEQRRQYAREYYKANPERWANRDPERRRQANRSYYQANAERMREKARTYYHANVDRLRENKRRNDTENRDELRAASRRRYAEGYRKRKDLERAQFTLQLWQEQDGRCYLCGELVTLEAAQLEHDHRCCPAARWCSYCVRGVACSPCNTAIGLLRDDPDLLERVAVNLRAKLAETETRLAAKPEQLELG